MVGSSTGDACKASSVAARSPCEDTGRSAEAEREAHWPLWIRRHQSAAMSWPPIGFLSPPDNMVKSVKERDRLRMKRIPQSRRGMSLVPVMRGVVLAVMLAGCAGQIYSQQAAAASQVPVLDGGAGPCSAAFTVTDSKGPVYAAKIEFHAAYGVFGVHKLYLQIGTNSEGKASFTGLPDKVKGDRIYFHASQGDRSGDASIDPSNTCNANLGIFLVAH